MEPRHLTNLEQAIVRSQDPKGRKLPDVVEMAVGMPCMVTMNVKTEHDLANGTRGLIVNITKEKQTSFTCAFLHAIFCSNRTEPMQKVWTAYRTECFRSNQRFVATH